MFSKLTPIDKEVLSFARSAKKDTILQEGFIAGNVAAKGGIPHEAAERSIVQLAASGDLKRNEISIYLGGGEYAPAENYAITFKGIVRSIIGR